MLIGSPMGAGGFATLAGHFPDRTVVTYDPRGVERSTKADPTPRVDARAARRRHPRGHRAVGGGPVDLFASSGGAVNALALVARHPDDVRTLVAHEPPLAALLPDRENALAATAGDPRHVPARAASARRWRSSSRSSATGPDPGRLRRPAGPGSGDVRPAGRGRRHARRPAARPEHRHVHALRARRRRACVRPRPGSSSPSARSPGASWPIAAARRSPSGSGPTPVVFPSGHGGFLGGEYGQSGEPDAFAAKLREVLAG